MPKTAGAATSQRDILTEQFREWQRSLNQGLESVTRVELALLADHALTGPGVVLGRALHRFAPACLDDDGLPELFDLCWNGLRVYLSRGLFKAALCRGRERYPEALRRAVAEGNLEAVLDEHFWIAGRLNGNRPMAVAKELDEVFRLVSGRHRVHAHDAKRGVFTLRCHAALPFSDAKLEVAEGKLRTDDLRRAFNSPFWPHVLVSTSAGQEGLDFHAWCRQVLHWDLPSNPLDLEQREGRVQRHGGLSIRHRLSRLLQERVVAEINASPSAAESPWDILARMADAEAADASGLGPWWRCEGETIGREIVHIPMSRHVRRFVELSQQRVLYRLALGQPHQQDFVERLSALSHDRDAYALRLSAWEPAGPGN